MFKTEKLKGTYICNCCERPKIDPLMIHVRGLVTSILLVICSECLEELLGQLSTKIPAYLIPREYWDNIEQTKDKERRRTDSL